jgi:dTDP-3-amino-3,4,6-trideoxy-alpha-D-glucose transaminase
MRVPFLDLAAATAPRRAELDAALARSLDESLYVGGAAVAEFESAWADFCGVGHAIGVGSGTAALELALRAAGLRAGDEVLVPANTCVPTVAAIESAGATPVLVDAHPETWTLDPDRLADARSAKTRAIVPVHLYGRVADLEATGGFAREHGLLVVEDAAQAHGLEGVAGDSAAAAFSFYPTKNLGALGDAGAIVTNDDAVAEHARRLRSYGEDERYHSVEPGTNSRLDTMQAAVLLAKLGHLRAWNERRRRLAARYHELLVDLPLELPVWDDGSVWHLYVVRVAEREGFRAALRAGGIGTAVHYPRAIHQHPAYARLGRDLPVAEALAREVVSLPLHPELGDAEQDAVVDAIRAWAA